MKIFFTVFALGLGALLVGMNHAYGATDKEDIVLDSKKGDYIITYLGWDDETHQETWRQTTFTPSNKVDPLVNSYFTYKESPDSIRYQYKITNGKKSSQNLDMVVINTTTVTASSQVSPAGWDVSVVPNYTGTGFRAAWSYMKNGNDDAGLVPGNGQQGFGFASRDLPGVNIIQLSGSAPVISYVDEGPSGLFEEKVSQLVSNNRSVSRNAAVPRISVPSPYDAAMVLTNIQKHLDTDLVSLKLVDPALVAQMDPWFATAIDAARRNNTVGLRNAIQELRRLLKQECVDVDQEGNETETDDKPVPPARIAKLAARVLNFDLKYVGSRI